MGEDANYCRAQAKFWMDMAEATKRPDFRDRWLRLAQQWCDLAEELEDRDAVGRSNWADADRAAKPVRRSGMHPIVQPGCNQRLHIPGGPRRPSALWQN